MDAFVELVDKKLGEVRVTLLAEFKVALDNFVEEKKAELTLFISEENSKNLSLSSGLAASVLEIQMHVSELRADNILLKTRVEDLQQYTRRQNVRIFGIPVNDSETSKGVEEKVKNLMEGIGIPAVSLNRAHRIGRKKKVNEVDIQPIIARFGTFRDRTTFYKGRKSVKEDYGYGISLDLTMDRYTLLYKICLQRYQLSIEGPYHVSEALSI